MKASQRCSATGFTLIELLVVVAIIVLLISILLPSLSRAKRSAVTVSCGNTLRQLGYAEIFYANDNSNNWTRACYRGQYSFNPAASPNGSWASALVALEYVALPDGTKNPLTCPGDVRTDKANILGYCFNIGMPPYPPDPYGPHPRTDKIGHPSLSIILFDHYPPYVPPSIVPPSVWWLFESAAAARDCAMVFPHHEEKSNALFFDGHVELIGPAPVSQGWKIDWPKDK